MRVRQGAPLVTDTKREREQYTHLHCDPYNKTKSISINQSEKAIRYTTYIVEMMDTQTHKQALDSQGIKDSGLPVNKETLDFQRWMLLPRQN